MVTEQLYPTFKMLKQERDRPMSNSKEFDNFEFSKETPSRTYFHLSEDGWMKFEKYDDAVVAAKRMADEDRSDVEIFETTKTLHSIVKYPVPDYEVEKV